MLTEEGVTVWDVTSIAVVTHAVSLTHASVPSPFVLVDFPAALPGHAELQAGVVGHFKDHSLAFLFHCARDSFSGFS